MLPLGFGRFMHLVVLYGYQGTGSDPEQLALTDQLFDAALGELSYSCSKAALLTGWDFSPPKSLDWQKGFRLGPGLTLRRLGLQLLVCNLPPTCSGTGILLVVIVGILRLFVLWLLLLFFPARFRLVGGLLLILRLGLSLTAAGGLVGSLSLCNALLFGWPLGCLLLIRVGDPSRLRFRGFARCMMSVCSISLGRML